MKRTSACEANIAIAPMEIWKHDNCSRPSVHTHYEDLGTDKSPNRCFLRGNPDSTCTAVKKLQKFCYFYVKNV